jgi:MoxR-like ATPase
LISLLELSSLSFVERESFYSYCNFTEGYLKIMLKEYKPASASKLDRPSNHNHAHAANTTVETVLFELKRLIAGQDYLLERILVALLSRGHVLLEGVPGLAKTATIKALAQIVGGTFGRVQFTPDMVPSDLTGTRIYNSHKAEFSTELGPVFVNLLLADEINRAPAKVQSALLEVMQERQVTVGKQTFAVPSPFLVMATQNPIESDGTYPLPEAQLDRFMFKIMVDYPSYNDEIVVVERVIGPKIELKQRISVEQLSQMQEQVDQIYVDPVNIAYAARIVSATRHPAENQLPELAGTILFGGSPRASINMVMAARALAFIRGRDYVLPQDVADVARDVLRHRLILSYEGIAAGITPDTIVTTLLNRYQPPRIDLGDRHVA